MIQDSFKVIFSHSVQRRGAVIVSNFPYVFGRCFNESTRTIGDHLFDVLMISARSDLTDIYSKRLRTCMQTKSRHVRREIASECLDDVVIHVLNFRATNTGIKTDCYNRKVVSGHSEVGKVKIGTVADVRG